MLYVDADFGGEALNVRSTSGGYLVLAGPKTFFPLMWLAKRQTSTSRSTTESEVVALAESLFHEAVPALELWELILGRKVELNIKEDNQATIKIIRKGYSHKLRHLNRVHKIDISSIKELLDDETFTLEYINTDEQAADIYTKGLPVHKWDNALRLLGVHDLGDSPFIKPKSSGTGGPGPVSGSQAAKSPAVQRVARMGGSPAPLSPK